MSLREQYQRAVIDIMRQRLAELRPSGDSQLVVFLGKSRQVIDDLLRLWEALPHRDGLVPPEEVIGWL
jgi:hypothetical protein